MTCKSGRVEFQSVSPERCQSGEEIVQGCMESQSVTEWLVLYEKIKLWISMKVVGTKYDKFGE